MVLTSYIVALALIVSSNAQTVCSGVGSVCLDPTTYAMCTCQVPGTTCAAAPDGSGAWTCQYTFCLPDNMICDGNIGSCCSTSTCEQRAGQPYRTCNPLPTTTTTTITTTVTNPSIIIEIGTTTASTASTTSPTAAASTAASSSCRTVSGAVTGAACVFPFKFMGQTFNSCTTTGGFKKPWCSTSTDVYGNHVRGTWGDCDNSCPGVSNIPSAATCPTPCKFPFIFQGKVHYACTFAGGFSPAWCSTKTDGYGKHITGNFADCGVGCPVEI